MYLHFLFVLSIIRLGLRSIYVLLYNVIRIIVCSVCTLLYMGCMVLYIHTYNDVSTLSSEESKCIVRTITLLWFVAYVHL